MGFPDVSQFPLNVVGPKGQNAFIGLTRILTGTGGLPLPFGSGTARSTTLGIPGVTATLVATGTYSLTFPTTVDVTILPHVSVPSGFSAQPSGFSLPDANVILPYSGVSGAGRLVVNPGLATGASVDLLFFVAPVTAY